MELRAFARLIKVLPVSYQAGTSKWSTWQKFEHLHRVGPALKGLFGPDEKLVLSRDDLRELGRDDDLAPFVVATIVWGYPSGMRGANFASLAETISQITRKLKHVQKRGVPNWQKHYEKLGFYGVGISTWSKLLNFLDVQVENHKALILDDRIINVLKERVFEELESIQIIRRDNAHKTYPQYIEKMHELASRYKVDPEALEMFVFSFGPTLKRPKTGSPP